MPWCEYGSHMKMPRLKPYVEAETTVNAEMVIVLAIYVNRSERHRKMPKKTVASMLIAR